MILIQDEVDVETLNKSTFIEIGGTWQQVHAISYVPTGYVAEDDIIEAHVTDRTKVTFNRGDTVKILRVVQTDRS